MLSSRDASLPPLYFTCGVSTTTLCWSFPGGGSRPPWPLKFVSTPSFQTCCVSDPDESIEKQLPTTITGRFSMRCPLFPLAEWWQRNRVWWEAYRGGSPAQIFPLSGTLRSRWVFITWRMDDCRAVGMNGVCGLPGGDRRFNPYRSVCSSWRQLLASVGQCAQQGRWPTFTQPGHSSKPPHR